MYQKIWDPSDFPREGEKAGAAAGSSGAAAASSNAEHSSPVLDELDGQLRQSGAQFFSGQAQPSAADREALETVKKSGKLSPQRHPSLYGWYSIVSRYTDELRSSWK